VGRKTIKRGLGKRHTEPRIRPGIVADQGKGFLNYAQYRPLFDALLEELRVPVVIGYHIGARKSEILGIKLEQIDLHDSVIRLYDTKKHVEGRWLAIYGEMGDTIGKQVGQPLGITLVALGSPIVKATLLLTFDPHGQTPAGLLVFFLAFCSTIYGGLLLGIWSGQG
jgi:integrase